MSSSPIVLFEGMSSILAINSFLEKRLLYSVRMSCNLLSCRKDSSVSSKGSGFELKISDSLSASIFALSSLF